MPRPQFVDEHLGRRALVDIAGIARYLASSERHVKRLVAERRIPHHKVGHFVRFDLDDIDEWLRSTRRGPAA
jgi:excisionase family DNA binding protein